MRMHITAAHLHICTGSMLIGMGTLVDGYEALFPIILGLVHYWVGGMLERATSEKECIT